MKKLIVYIILLCSCNNLLANNKKFLALGWQALLQDEDSLALSFFNSGLKEAIISKDKFGQAEALLKIGIASYGASLHNGMYYATEALKIYESINNTQGRGKVLQLLATIKAREGKLQESLKLSHDALYYFNKNFDSTTYVGLIYTSLGTMYEKLNKQDSANLYFDLAFIQRIKDNDTTYLPSAYLNYGKALLKGNKTTEALTMFNNALFIANNSGNRQAQVSALLAICKCINANGGLVVTKDSIIYEAKKIASNLTDKNYLLQVLGLQKAQLLERKNFKAAYLVNEEILSVHNQVKNYEEDRLAANLEVQFDVKETERKLIIETQNNKIVKLTNYLLLALGLIGIAIILFYRKLNRQGQQLLQQTQIQKKLNEEKLSNEIAFKESQLSALVIQMAQKKEMLLEIRQKLTENKVADNSINKILFKEEVQSDDWNNFNKTFESINKNFYQRIINQYPDVSPNELKICALMKMNLNTKEMAGILNITPDSVKTARYRLRKKLQLQTEDNLTNFILSL